MQFPLICSIFAALLTVGACQMEIFYGRDAKPGKYMVYLQIPNKPACGGAILNKNWIITAAHCTHKIHRKDLKVVVGITKLSDKNGQTFNVIKKVEHPKFNRHTRSNDISLLKLEYKIRNTIPLKLNRKRVGSNVSVKTSGWGEERGSKCIPNRLQIVNLKTASDDKCSKYLKGKRYIFDNNTLCTLSQKKRAYIGQSGEPLFNGKKLVGIDSWGTSHGHKVFIVYARVSKYVDWINENINKKHQHAVSY